jgi:ureidoacrylate peracid hydrolase
MHKVLPSTRVISRIIERRGTLHPLKSLVSSRTAHIVVDLQNGFMAPGQPAEIAEAREVVPNVNRISQAVRDAGGLVVFIQNTFDAEALAAWSTYFDMFSSPSRKERMVAAFTPGSFGHQLWPGLDIQSTDLKVLKRRFGAFVQGSSDLHQILQSRGIDTLIITGTATNVCCESTARDAMMLNYKVAFISDGCATFNDEEHNATLDILAYAFADVMSTDEVLALLAAAAPAAPPAAEPRQAAE